ncbi:MAG: hypothetical protein ABMA13_23445 [Chthoniobacteraceae bacterium]
MIAILLVVVLLALLLISIVEQTRAFRRGFDLGKKSGYLEGRQTERTEGEQ